MTVFVFTVPDGIVKVISERPGSVAANAPPDTVVDAWSALLFEEFVSHDFTVAPFATPVPFSAKLTVSEPLPVFSATTAIVPLVFLNASRVRLPSVVLAPMRTAPGRT